MKNDFLGVNSMKITLHSNSGNDISKNEISKDTRKESILRANIIALHLESLQKVFEE